MSEPIDAKGPGEEQQVGFDTDTTADASGNAAVTAIAANIHEAIASKDHLRDHLNEDSELEEARALLDKDIRLDDQDLELITRFAVKYQERKAEFTQESGRAWERLKQEIYSLTLYTIGAAMLTKMRDAKVSPKVIQDYTDYFKELGETLVEHRGTVSISAALLKRMCSSTVEELRQAISVIQECISETHRTCSEKKIYPKDDMMIFSHHLRGLESQSAFTIATKYLQGKLKLDDDGYYSD